jgi:hypothetical protein
MFRQGKKFENNQKKYKKLVNNFNLIQISQLNIVDNLKSNNFSDILEGFGEAITDKNIEEGQKLQDLENTFNVNLGKYNELFKTYLEELSSSQGGVNPKIRDKVITYNGKRYYINNRGVARQFTEISWKDRDNSCVGPGLPIESAEFGKLTKNAKQMYPGEECRSGGYIAKHPDGTTAWVDDGAVKHRFPLWNDKHPTCPDEKRLLTDVQYNALSSGADYTANDKCNLISLDSPTYRQLVTLNDKLINNIINMKIEVNKLSSTDNSLSADIKTQKNTLKEKHSELLEEQEKIKKIQGDISQYTARIQEQNLSVPAIQMHHLIWVIIGGAFIVTAIYNSK